MSVLAKKLIAENRVTRSKLLDLGKCGLNEVPAEVGELVWLEWLSFAVYRNEWDGKRFQLCLSKNIGRRNERLADLRPLAGLHALKSLYLGHTRVGDLTPLVDLPALRTLDISRTQIFDLAWLPALSSLQTLSLCNTEVRDLTPLVGLPSLQMLDASNTRVSDLRPLSGLSFLQVLSLCNTQVSDLTPLAGLSALQALDVSDTQIGDLTPLAGLSALQALDVEKTRVKDLRPLAGLLSLQTLDLCETQVSDLRPLAGLSALRFLDVSKTRVRNLSPLSGHVLRGVPVEWQRLNRNRDAIYIDSVTTTPPPEIIKQGRAAIRNYFREREVGGVDHLYEAKMLILGEGGAGKTSLLRRLYQRGVPLPKEDETTKGIAIYRHEFPLKNGRRFRLNVWDFGGQQIYHATHQFFLTHRSLYVLVDDTRKDYKSVTDEGFKYWLELIDVFSDHSPTLIFQNEKGGRSKQIDLAGIRARFDNVKEVYTGNLDNRDAADAIRDAIEHFASHLSHIGEEVPARWIKVREDIERLAIKKPHVPMEDYFKIYRRHIEFSEAKALLLSRYLHDLGVFLHFQDDELLARTIILQNEWATEAVFRILDDETVRKKLGRFNQGDCRRLWKDSVYARMHLELLALMQKFELCYELRDSRPQTWLAPQLLPAERPAALSEWGKPDDLVLRYRYEFLPKGMISRLTVRQHRFVMDPKKAWISGVLFEREGSSVLAEILANSEIELRARGPERKALLSAVAADLDGLNESFQGLRDKVDKRIPCNCSKCHTSPGPEFFGQRRLEQRKKDGKLMVECPRSYEDMDVLELLDGVKLGKQPVWAKEEAASRPQRKVRIFLASSQELREDRDEFDLYLRQQNDSLLEAGVYLTIVRWENFLDAMSETRLQDEYNKAIRECDVFVSLFFTKTGKFTEEEFDAAHAQFESRGRPLIYTYFKNADIKIGSVPKDDLKSRWAFQEKVEKLRHFYTEYDNIEGLKLHFRGQIEKILERLQ